MDGQNLIEEKCRDVPVFAAKGVDVYVRIRGAAKSDCRQLNANSPSLGTREKSLDLLIGELAARDFTNERPHLFGGECQITLVHEENAGARAQSAHSLRSGSARHEELDIARNALYQDGQLTDQVDVLRSVESVEGEDRRIRSRLQLVHEVVDESLTHRAAGFSEIDAAERAWLEAEIRERREQLCGRDRPVIRASKGNPCHGLAAVLRRPLVDQHALPVSRRCTYHCQGVPDSLAQPCHESRPNEEAAARPS